MKFILYKQLLQVSTWTLSVGGKLIILINRQAAIDCKFKQNIKEKRKPKNKAYTSNINEIVVVWKQINPVKLSL